jgi:Tfp pilus assembly protein PilF
VTDSEWRKRVLETRIATARTGMLQALQEMGRTEASYFTPEERGGFAQFAEKLRQPMNLTDVESLAVPLAEAAGLEDLEARWKYELAMDTAPDWRIQQGRMLNYAQLQRRRLKFAELAPQLEQFAPRLPSGGQPSMLLEASRAYRSAGDTTNELRVLMSTPVAYVSGENQQRYFELLLKQNPQVLINAAANWTVWGEQAAQFAIANGSAEMAHQVVAGRSRARVPVWRSAYDALTGLYFAEATPAVNKSFLDALGDQTIGERIGKKIDRDQQLAGDIWFYYGSRYGEYLAAAKQGNPEDFLAAVLEQSPASAGGYLQVADYYADSGDARAAITDYLHVLELVPSSVEAHLRLALAYVKQGDRASAIKQWKLAIAQLSQQVKRVAVPEGFWTDFGRLCQQSASRHAFAELKPDVDALLRAYLKKNGNYRSNELLKSAYTAVGDPAAATAWLIDLSTAASDPITVLADVADVPWIPAAQRASIYARVVAGKSEAADKAVGTEKQYAVAELRNWQFRWANYLVLTKQFQAADTLLSSLPKDAQAEHAGEFIPLELQIAAHLGTLDARLTSYRADEESAPAAEILRAAAQRLQKEGDRASERKILEFVFAREIDRHNLVASNFLGLAEIRIAAGDLPGAMQLLRRLTVVVGEPFENLEPAAALLEKTGHPAEAGEFLEQLSKATPWNAAYRLRWARARIAAGAEAAGARDDVAKIAADGSVFYSVRVDATLGLGGQRPATALGSKELSLLSGAPAQLSVAAADQPFFYDARVRAVKNATDAQAKLQILRKAVEDFPAREEARYLLFETAAGARADVLAIAALEGTSAPQLAARRTGGEGEDEAEQTNEAQPEEQAFEAPELNKAALSRAHQARICSQAAEVLERLGRLTESLAYLRASRRLETSAARRSALRTRIAATRKELARRKENEARQPVLHQALEQNRLVRPRIALAATPPAGKGVAHP